jgi:hypothetical protein
MARNTQFGLEKHTHKSWIVPFPILDNVENSMKILQKHQGPKMRVR